MKSGLLPSPRQVERALVPWLKRAWFLLPVLGLAITWLLANAPALAQASTETGLGWQGWLTIAITLAAFFLNALTSLSAEVIFLGALAVLLLSGVLDTPAALAGFSNPVSVDA